MNNVVNFACVPQVHIIIIYLINSFFSLPAKWWNFRRFPFCCCCRLVVSMNSPNKESEFYSHLCLFRTNVLFAWGRDEWRKERTCFNLMTLSQESKWCNYDETTNEICVCVGSFIIIIIIVAIVHVTNQTRTEYKRDSTI